MRRQFCGLGIDMIIPPSFVAAFSLGQVLAEEECKPLGRSHVVLYHSHCMFPVSPVSLSLPNGILSVTIWLKTQGIVGKDKTEY